MSRAHRQYWRIAPRVVDAGLLDAGRVIDRAFVDESLPKQMDELPRIDRLNADLARGRQERARARQQMRRRP